MCTVSYIPTNSGYVLTSNRDEHPKRETKEPKTIILNNGTKITAPIDSLKGGTWIAIDDSGRSACLLNGAFEKHISTGNYRKSRGAFVIEAFEATDFESFVASVNLDNIEPFTLILAENQSVIELVWDGLQKHIKHYSNDKSLLWSSATLYTREEHSNKENYFRNVLSLKSLSKDNILAIHGVDEVTPFILEHHLVRTVSITQLSFDGDETKISYTPRPEKVSVKL